MFVLLGAGATAVVGYLVAQNPEATPPQVAVGLRVAIIAALVAAGAYAQTNTGQVQMGILLVATGLFASLWLLNGSSDPALFSIGMLLRGLAPTLFAYLMLTYPSGRLRSSAERRLPIGAGGAMFALWTFLVLTCAQPPLKTPLLACAPHCPTNELFVGTSGSGALALAKAGLFLTWAVLAFATPVLLSARLRHGAQPPRRSFVPLEIGAVASSVALTAFAATSVVGSKASSALGAPTSKPPCWCR